MWPSPSMWCHGRFVSLLGSLIGMGHGRGICTRKDLVRVDIPPPPVGKSPRFHAFLLPSLVICKPLSVSELHLPHL